VLIETVAAGRVGRRESHRSALLGAALCNLEPGADDMRARRCRTSCRGTVEAYDAPGGPVTLSILSLEEYVRSVISAEVSWSWGLFGGTTDAPRITSGGSRRLEAQAVATRSYVAAEIVSGGWAPYATACDSYCQSYPGMVDENPMSNAAESDTAGEILEQPAATSVPGASGGIPGTFAVPATPGTAWSPVSAEYSASSGGYTASGEFPGVVDRGDAVCIKSRFYSCNPCHKWWASIPVSAIEKAFPLSASSPKWK